VDILWQATSISIGAIPSFLIDCCRFFRVRISCFRFLHYSGLVFKDVKSAIYFHDPAPTMTPMLFVAFIFIGAAFWSKFVSQNPVIITTNYTSTQQQEVNLRGYTVVKYISLTIAADLSFS
jgi:hypothetical protein